MTQETLFKTAYELEQEEKERPYCPRCHENTFMIKSEVHPEFKWFCGDCGVYIR